MRKIPLNQINLFSSHNKSSIQYSTEAFGIKILPILNELNEGLDNTTWDLLDRNMHNKRCNPKDFNNLIVSYSESLDKYSPWHPLIIPDFVILQWRTRSESSRLRCIYHSIDIALLKHVLGVLETDVRRNVRLPKGFRVVAVTPCLGLLHATNHSRIGKDFMPQGLVVLQLGNPSQEHFVTVALDRVIGQGQFLEAHQRL